MMVVSNGVYPYPNSPESGEYLADRSRIGAGRATSAGAGSRTGIGHILVSVDEILDLEGLDLQLMDLFLLGFEQIGIDFLSVVFGSRSHSENPPVDTLLEQ